MCIVYVYLLGLSSSINNNHHQTNRSLNKQELLLFLAASQWCFQNLDPSIQSLLCTPSLLQPWLQKRRCGSSHHSHIWSRKKRGESRTVLADFISASLAKTVTYTHFSRWEMLKNCKPEFSWLTWTNSSLKSEHILSQNTIGIFASMEEENKYNICLTICSCLLQVTR